MAFENLRQVFTELKQYRKPKLCVAAAADETVLQAVRDARKEDLVDFILVGHEEKIWRMAMTISLNLGGIEIINVRDPLEAVQRAVGAVAKGQADFLMKGMVNTTDLLHAVLNRESGLRIGKLLSHIAVYEIPGYYRLIYMTDGGINITPDLEQKRAIIQNAVDFMRSVGLERPRVAVLSANERINPKMPSSVDAGKLKEMAQSGEIRGAEVDGPIALDVAINLEAAAHKGLQSFVAGRADLLAVPNIEAGNLLGKAIMYFAGGKMAGLVLGAACPIVVTSRHETPYGKMASIALGGYSVVRSEGVS